MQIHWVYKIMLIIYVKTQIPAINIFDLQQSNLNLFVLLNTLWLKLKF